MTAASITFGFVELAVTAPFYAIHDSRDDALRAAAERAGDARFFDPSSQEWQFLPGAGDPQAGDLVATGTPDEQAGRQAVLATVAAANQAIGEDNTAVRHAAAQLDIDEPDSVLPERPPIVLAGAEGFLDAVAVLQAWNGDRPANPGLGTDLWQKLKGMWRKIRG